MIKSLSLALFILAVLSKPSVQQYNGGSAPLCVQTGACNQPAINPCSPNPCLNYGICSSNDGVTFKCTCSPNYSGVRCERPAQTNPCQNNLCGQQSNPCGNNPCQNGGSCVTSGTQGYICHCPVYYTGQKCEIYTPPRPVTTTSQTGINPCQNNLCGQQSNPCGNNPCQNGGSCVTSGTQGYICHCPVYYTGQKCEIYTPPRPVTTTKQPVLNPCLSNPCAQGSTCLYNIQSVNNPVFMCVCPPNMQGTRCDQPVSPCSSNPCKNGGTCVSINQVSVNPPYACVCPNTHTGLTCEAPVQQNPCPSNTCGQTNQCQNGGWLQNGYCLCPSKYTGKFCEIQVQQNLCQNNICGNNNQNACANNPCQNGGTCVPIKDTNANPPYACVCPVAYTGLKCEIFQATTTTTTTSTQLPNPCATNPCQNGRCIPITQPSSVKYVCICYPNYSGPSCNQYNPPTTTTTTTTTTQKPDPCLSRPCQNGGTCVTLNIANVAPFACLCTRDFTGKYCENRLDTCQCLNGGTCQNGVCYCPVNYTGRRCETLVQQNPCQNSYCGNNYQFNPCSNNPCQNGGTCQRNGQNFVCSCPIQYTGVRCEQYVQNQNPCQSSYCGNKQSNDPCSSSPCKNGATCRSTGFGYQCDCVVGFVGNQCETRQFIDLCATNSCYNGGTCQTLRRGQDQYTVMCHCPPEYTGSRCQIKAGVTTTRQANIALPCQCLNGGVCKSGVCECPSNFYGTRCEFQRNFQTTTLAPVNQEVKCPSGLCINGRCAQARGSGFFCVCNYGWTGSRCTIRNFCQTHSAQCKNGGICLNADNGFMCKCRPGFTGQNCEQTQSELQIQITYPCGQSPCPQTPNADSYCQNGGTSYTQNGNEMCQCPRGYIGLKCEVDICNQEKLIGPCKQSIPRYYYNSQTKACESFLFGGCSANENNFASLESCNFNCKGH